LATEGQPAEQGLAFVVESIRFAFKLDGHEVPSRAEVEAELERS
jgi:hypothetical protein